MCRLTMCAACLLAGAVLGSGSATAADVPGNATTKATVPVSGSSSGVIDRAGDQDWYRVTLKEYRKYRFALSSGGAARGPVRVLDSGGNVLASGATAAEVRSNEDGKYFVAVGGPKAARGAYRLRGSVADPGFGPGTERTITPGKPEQGKMTSGGSPATGDWDSYLVKLSIGTRYKISVELSLGEEGNGCFLEFADNIDRDEDGLSDLTYPLYDPITGEELLTESIDNPIRELEAIPINRPTGSLNYPYGLDAVTLPAPNSRAFMLTIYCYSVQTSGNDFGNYNITMTPL